MPNEMLDILVDQKKVEEIALLPSPGEVEKKLKKEGLEVTPEDVKVLGNVFKTISEKGPEELDEKVLGNIGGGMSNPFKNIDWKSDKAKKAYKVIAGVVGTAVLAGGAYEVDKRFNAGKGMNAIKDAPGKVKGWFSHSATTVTT